MPRDVFPHEDDRAIIRRFLLGAKRIMLQTDYLMLNEGRLVLCHVPSGSTIAWYDTAGALTVQFSGGLGYPTAVRAVHDMCKQLGMPEVQVTRERRTNDTIHPGWEMVTFVDGQEVKLGQPYVLLGGLGMQAWRAGEGKR